MDQTPLVSVLMTAFNREKYIAEAIESILASTYTNFELIIVDDCSKDKTIEIAKNYENKDDRIKVYVNENNIGDYPNRNKAASYSKGKYLKYVDADDYIYPRGLEILIDMMELFPNAGWGLCSLMQYYKKPFPFELNPKQAYEYHYMGPGLFHKAPLSSIIKKETFNLVDGFKNIRMAGDFDMWHRLAKVSNVVLMPEGIVWYREHVEQEMKSYRQFIKVYEKIKIDHLKDNRCPFDPSISIKIIKKARIKIWRNLFSALIKFKYTSVLDNLKRLSCYAWNN